MRTLLPLLALAATAACAEAQTTRRSQRAAVTQHLGPAQITVTYSRPVARGRALFGTLVPWGRVWNPGADSATLVSFGADVTVEGRPLAKGEYTLWMIPEERAPWTVIFSRAAHIWHVPYPGDRQDVLRLEVAPVSGDHMETLAFYFPVVDADSSVIRMHWGTTIIPIAVKLR